MPAVDSLAAGEAERVGGGEPGSYVSRSLEELVARVGRGQPSGSQAYLLDKLVVPYLFPGLLALQQALADSSVGRAAGGSGGGSGAGGVLRPAVLDALADALVDVCRRKPEDPVDALAELLFRSRGKLGGAAGGARGGVVDGLQPLDWLAHFLMRRNAAPVDCSAPPPTASRSPLRLGGSPSTPSRRKAAAAAASAARAARTKAAPGEVVSGALGRAAGAVAGAEAAADDTDAVAHIRGVPRGLRRVLVQTAYTSRGRRLLVTVRDMSPLCPLPTLAISAYDPSNSSTWTLQVTAQQVQRLLPEVLEADGDGDGDVDIDELAALAVRHLHLHERMHSRELRLVADPDGASVVLHREGMMVSGRWLMLEVRHCRGQYQLTAYDPVTSRTYRLQLPSGLLEPAGAAAASARLRLVPLLRNLTLRKHLRGHRLQLQRGQAFGQLSQLHQAGCALGGAFHIVRVLLEVRAVQLRFTLLAYDPATSTTRRLLYACPTRSAPEHTAQKALAAALAARLAEDHRGRLVLNGAVVQQRGLRLGGTLWLVKLHLDAAARSIRLAAYNPADNSAAEGCLLHQDAARLALVAPPLPADTRALQLALLRALTLRDGDVIALHRPSPLAMFRSPAVAKAALLALSDAPPAEGPPVAAVLRQLPDLLDAVLLPDVTPTSAAALRAELQQALEEHRQATVKPADFLAMLGYGLPAAAAVSGPAAAGGAGRGVDGSEAEAAEQLERIAKRERKWKRQRDLARAARRGYERGKGEAAFVRRGLKIDGHYLMVSGSWDERKEKLHISAHAPGSCEMYGLVLSGGLAQQFSPAARGSDSEVNAAFLALCKRLRLRHLPRSKRHALELVESPEFIAKLRAAFDQLKPCAGRVQKEDLQKLLRSLERRLQLLFRAVVEKSTMTHVQRQLAAHAGQTVSWEEFQEFLRDIM